MAGTREIAYILSERPGIGSRRLGDVLASLGPLPPGHPCEVADRVAEARSSYLAPPLTQACVGIDSNSLAVAERRLAALAALGIDLLTPIDAAYPASLRSGLDPPPAALYTYGCRTLLSRPLVALASSNGSDLAALEATDALAEIALDVGFRPVTGHNRSTYQRLALLARRRGVGICYVVDRGILEAFGGDLSRELFPAAAIWGPSYDPLTDLTLSPFPLCAHGQGTNNRIRDSVVFALAGVVIAGELRPGGQMHRRCLEALKRGTAVYVEASAWCATHPLAHTDAIVLDAGRMSECRTALDKQMCALCEERAHQ